MLIFILTVLLASLFITDNVSSSPATVVSTDPRPSTAPPDTTFDLNITITDVFNLYAWEVNMTFDTTILRIVTVTEGEFLLRAGTTLMPTPVIDNEHGYVTTGNALFPNPEHGADGSGTLATITFSVQKKGKSALAFDNTKLRSWDWDAGELVEILHTAMVGYFRYTLGDANGDGVVNMQDLSQISAHWYPGPPPGPSGYDLDTDLNLDERITMQEISTVSAYWTGPPAGPLAP